MENKLQELTNQLYQEGLLKGRTEAEALLAQAQQEAGQLVERAKKEAASILETAQKEAAEHKEQVENEIRMASRQTTAALKQQVEQMVVFKSLETPVKQAVSDSDFVQSLIKTLVEAYNPHGAQNMDLDVVLPQAQKEQLASFLKSKIAALFDKNFSVSFSSDLDNGFCIGPKDGSYQIRFTDRDFIALFSQYLRPKTRELIYGQ